MNISYKTLFKLPDEAELTHCICTTMSMSPEEQLRIIACAYGFGKVDKINVNLLVDRSRDRFFFFYDDRKTDMKDLANIDSAEAVTELMKMSFPAPHGRNAFHVFHPKIVLVRFMLNGEPHYRLQVSSKNLTPGNVFETGAQLVSVPCSGKTPNHNIHELLTYLLSDNSNKERLEEKLNGLTEELKGLKFVIPSMEEGSNFKIIVSGINGKKQDQELRDIIDKEEKSKSKRLYILSPDYETSNKKIKTHRVYKPKDGETHAKLYFLPDKDGGTVWLGSCNLSYAAMNGGNVECMVKVTNAGGLFSYDNRNDIFKVFSTECSPITQKRPFTGASNYGAIEKLAKFVKAAIFSGCDCTKTYSTSNKPFRSSKVIIKNYTIPPNCTIEYLPFGYPETDNNKSKWRNLNVKYTQPFRTSRSGDPNGLLRVKLTDNGKSETAETVVVFDKTANDNLQNSIYSYSEFISVDWIGKLMSAREHCEAESEYQQFKYKLESVKADTKQQQSLKECLDIYEAVYKALKF